MRNFYFTMALLFSMVTICNNTQGQTLKIQAPQSWGRVNGQIQEAVVCITPQGALVQYEYYLTISTIDDYYYYFEDEQLEIFYDFNLHPDAVVTDSWLWVEDEIVQGLIMEKSSANQIYESIVSRRRDPSILTKNSENSYTLKIYPMLQGQSRKAKITFILPATITPQQVYIDVPVSLISNSILKNDLEVRIFGEHEQVPNVFELPDKKINFVEGSENRSYYSLFITPDEFFYNPHISYANRNNNNIFLQEASDNGGYYQKISYSDNKDIDQGYKKLVLIIDQKKTHMFFQSSFINLWKNLIKEELSYQDSIMVFLFNNNEINNFNPQWHAVTNENVEMLFNPENKPAPKTQVSLTMAVIKANTFIHDTGGKGRLIVISDYYNNVGTAGKESFWDIKYFSPKVYPIHIVDFSDLGGNYYEQLGPDVISSPYLNQYATLSHGEYYALRDNFYTLPICLHLLNASDERFEITKSFYSTNSGINSEIFYLNYSFPKLYDELYAQNSIIQIGKYTENSSISQSTAYINNSNLYLDNFNTDSAIIQNENTIIQQYYIGKQIQELETNYNSKQINEMIELSLKYRVLSLHTAFFCPEPSDTVTACKDCWDNSQEEYFHEAVEDVNTNQIEISAYPNPFKEKLTIKLDMLNVSISEDIHIKLFNIHGQIIRLWEIKAGNVTGDIEWDGTNESGKIMPKGIYTLVVQFGDSAKTIKVIKS